MAISSSDDDESVTGGGGSSSSIGSKFKASLKSFLAGGVGGVAAVLVGHPFDLLKVRMQVGGSSVSSNNTGVFRALSKTVRSEGIIGLYRGVTAPLVASSPIYALSFWGYDIGSTVVRKISHGASTQEQEHQRPLSIPEIMVAGGLSALPMMAVIIPTERIKCMLQVQTATSSSSSITNATASATTTSIKKQQQQQPQQQRYKGMIDCGTKIYKSGGMSSLYKGTMISFMRDVPGSVAWFGTYEVMKQYIVQWQGIDNPSELSPIAVMTAGGFAGMACWATMIVPDTLKSRIQTAPDGMYNGIVDVYSKMVQQEGYASLFKGFRPAMIRAFPANASCFMGMEVAKKLLVFLD